MKLGMQVGTFLTLGAAGENIAAKGATGTHLRRW